MATPVPGVWGIDLGQCALKALRLEFVEGEVKATAFDYIEHPKILSQPDADPDQLIREALTQFLSRNNLRGDMVVISVPGQSGLARFVKLPPVEEKKIADIVKFEAKQQIPFPLEEVVWDFQKINQGEVTDGFAMETEIGLFAMKRDMVSRALTHFKDVNVEVHIIQMAPLALVNYVGYDLIGHTPGVAHEGKRDCIVALDIGTDNSNLVITDAGKIIWQRPIPLGGNHFTRVLTKDLKLTFAKAEHLKRNAAKSPDLKKILGSLKPVLNDFVGEVQRSLGYFTNTHRDATIQYMIGLGNAFRLPGLQKYLQEKLQLEVKKLQTFDRVKGDEVLGAPQFSENIMTFGVPYGLALQGLKQSKLQTNLLPYEVRVERIVRGKKPYAVAAAAALLLMVAGLTFGASLQRGSFINPEVKAALEQADKVTKRQQGLQSEMKQIEDQIKASDEAVIKISAGVGERFNWQLLMQYMNMTLPQPNGDKLTTASRDYGNVRAAFMTSDAQKALRMHEERRFAKATGAAVNAQKAAEDEEFIKAHLVQLNIEGITPLYSDDLLPFYKKIHKDTPILVGMTEAEKKMIADAAAGQDVKDLPLKGWVIEIRGYYYHKEGVDFLAKTLLENLKNPEQPGVNKGAISAEMNEAIVKNLGLFLKYKNEKIQNPEPGIFRFIKGSQLKAMLSGEAQQQGGGGFGQPPGERGGGGRGGAAPANLGNMMEAPGGAGAKEAGKPNRDAWRPIGEVAPAAIGGEAGSGFGMGFGAPPGERPPGEIKGMPAGPAGNEGGKALVRTRRQDRYEFIVYFVWKEPIAGAAVAADTKR